MTLQLPVFDFLGAVTSKPARTPVNGEHFVDKEEASQPRRKERRLQGNDDEDIVIKKSRFKPTTDMLKLRKKIEQARDKALEFLEKLRAQPKSLPDIAALKKLRSLMTKVAYIERMYENAEQKALELFETEKRVEAERIFKHEERSTKPLQFQFKRNRAAEILVPSKLKSEFECFVRTLNAERIRSHAQSGTRKQVRHLERQERREQLKNMWLCHMTETIKSEARRKYVEDEILDDEFERASQTAGKLREAKRLSEAARAAYADDLISDKELSSYQRLGL